MLYTTTCSDIKARVTTLIYKLKSSTQINCVAIAIEPQLGIQSTNNCSKAPAGSVEIVVTSFQCFRLTFNLLKVI